ncbi:hypothetical protein X975_04998, partial [Stegodyphus mimosarum]
MIKQESLPESVISHYISFYCTEFRLTYTKIHASVYFLLTCLPLIKRLVFIEVGIRIIEMGTLESRERCETPRFW